MSTSGEPARRRIGQGPDDFTTSIMVDIGLRSWPRIWRRGLAVAGEDETPAKYIDLDFEELRAFPGLKDHRNALTSWSTF